MNKLKSAKTAAGNEIELLELKNAKYDKTVLIIGVFHGDEPDGEFLIRKYLENAKNYDGKNRLLVVPCLNPDGKALNRRTNGNGVDLNRNFPTKNWELSAADEYFGGKCAGSEIETDFICRIIDDFAPDAVLTLHEPYKIVNFDGPAAEIASKIAQITGYPVQKDIGYPTPGSFGTYCGVERNIPVITLELPEKEDKSVLWNANKGIFSYFADLF